MGTYVRPSIHMIICKKNKGFSNQKTDVHRFFRTNKQIPWGIYVPRLTFIWGVKNGKVNQRTIGPVSIT